MANRGSRRRLALIVALLAPLLISLGEPPLRAQTTFASPAFEEVWAAADAPVAAGQARRAWLWGPAPITAGRQESYAGAPSGERLVQYFDKARMEDQSWQADVDPLWRVTTGRLVVELVTGAIDLGDGRQEARPSATETVAGDPGSGPTYADLAALVGRPPRPAGEAVLAHLAPGGSIENRLAPAAVTTVAVAEASRPIAAPFWTFMTGAGKIGNSPFFATGLPLTDAAWVDVRLAGQPRTVLIQAFERRVLTYAPGNTAGFTVEMGNVGQHYLTWRYGPLPAEPLALAATPLHIPAAVRAATPPERLERFTGREIALPAGLTIGLFAVLRQPRFAAFGPGGDLYVADQRLGQIIILPDRDRDGVADRQIVFTDGLNQPHNVTFAGGAVYVGETNGVRRLVDQDGDGRADVSERIIPLPEGGHWSRTVAIGPDGKLYVSIGSSCNICLETDQQRATIMQYELDGSGGRVYATGLRNSVGLVWQPSTNRLYATENGRDQMGNNVPPEEINEIRDGAHYGWPRCHGADIPDPIFGRDPDACAGQTPPVVEMQAHSAPLGLAFVPPGAFPVAQGDLIVAFHGSWNRTPPTGYKLVRLAFRDDRPTGEVEDFAVGFRARGTTWSRPVDVVFGPDGALFVTDDLGGAIYRIAPAIGSP